MQFDPVTVGWLFAREGDNYHCSRPSYFGIEILFMQRYDLAQLVLRRIWDWHRQSGPVAKVANGMNSLIFLLL